MSEKKSSSKKIVSIFAIGIIFILIVANYGTIVKIFFPPKPVVVSHDFNTNSSRLFEYSALVEAVVRNDGGDGDVVLEAIVYQDGNSWTKSMKRHFTSKETASMEIKFDEVKLLGGDIQSKIRVYPFGK